MPYMTFLMYLDLISLRQEGFTELRLGKRHLNQNIPHTLTMGRTIILSKIKEKKRAPNLKHTSYINYGKDDYTVTIKEKET